MNEIHSYGGNDNEHENGFCKWKYPKMFLVYVFAGYGGVVFEYGL